MERSPYFPFPPRPGMRIETAELAPENEGTKLNKGQLSEVIDFEHSLYSLELDPKLFPSAEAYKSEQAGVEASIPPIEDIWKKKINFFNVGVNYLLTDTGRESIANITGVSADYETKEDCIDFLSGINLSDVTSEAMDKLEADSVNFEQDMISEAFINNGFKGSSVPAPEIIRLYKNSDIILEKAVAYKRIKTYLKFASRDLESDSGLDPSVKQADQLLITLYRTKVNKLIASLYVSAEIFLAQPAAQSNNGIQLIEDLKKVLPAFSRHVDKMRNARFLQTLDEYRHGVSEDENGHYTWLSPEAKKLAGLAIESKPILDVDRGVYSDIDPQIFKSVEVDGETLGEWLRVVLDEYGILSEQTDWTSEREGPASDGKWQVIVNAKFKSLAVNDKQRIIQAPVKSKSLLMSLIRGSHEITHALQHENKRAIGDLAILDKIGIDTTSEQTESGAKWQEREAKEILTGKEDTTIGGLGYLRALRVKERGGTYSECLEEYFDQLVINKTYDDPKEAAWRAAGAARRIFRNGGLEFAQESHYVTDTQPLSYLEQELIYRSLDENDRKLLFIGGVTIDNLKRLAEVGLVDLDKIIVPKRKPIDILELKVRKFIVENQNS